MPFSQRNNYYTIYGFAILLALLFIMPIVAFPADAITPLTWQNLKTNAALGKQITLDAKHLPLSDLLAQAGKQGGVTLTLSSHSPLAQKLVTARISHMNLYDFMGAIGRTYNADWSKTGADEFTLTPKTADPIAEGIAQLGMPAFYRDRDDVASSVAAKIPGENNIKTRNDLYRKVLLAEGFQALRSEKGVPVNSLPPELATSLKKQYMQVDAVPLLMEYAAYKSITDKNVVRIKIEQDPQRLPLYKRYPLDDKVITIDVLQPNLLPIPGAEMHWLISGQGIEFRLREEHPDWYE
jgi:hypothetical protein